MKMKKSVAALFIGLTMAVFTLPVYAATLTPNILEEPPWMEVTHTVAL